MLSRGHAGALAAAAITMLLLIAPNAQALTKVTVTGTDQGDGLFVGKAKCDRGQNVISGGFSMPDTSDAVVNKAKGSRTWVVKGQDTDGPLKVHAYCSRRLEVSKASKAGRFSNVDFGARAKAKCGNDETAVAGGWQYDNLADNQPVYTSYGSGGRTWKVKAFSGDSQKITAYAYCLKGADVVDRSRTSDSIGTGENGAVKASCRPGEELLGGGFKTKPKSDYNNDFGPDFFYSRSARAGGRGWKTAAHNFSKIAGRTKVAALCLT